MASRRRARELALQLFYQQDVGGSKPQEAGRLFWEAHPEDERTRLFAGHLYERFHADRARVDDLIRRHAHHWSLDRMASVDRNLLRMAVSEFLYTETPRVVVIDEAIEISRKYSGEAAEFVNGVLDSVRRELETEEE